MYNEHKKIGIIGAMDEEIDVLTRSLNIQEIVETSGLKVINAKLGSMQCFIVRCGIGKVNAALCTQALIDRFDVDYIINVGVAGALHPDLDVNDVVISSEAIQYDIDASAAGDPVGTIPRMDTSVFRADEHLVKIAEKSASELHLGNYMVGRIVTGDKFVASKDFKDELRKSFDGLCCEMEGGAIAHVCHVNKVPFLIIRSISDKADGTAVKTFDNFLVEACEISKSIILKILRKI